MITVRIPKTNLYRAFPELDRFSDEQCERFMQRVRITGMYRPLCWTAISFASLVTLAVIAMALALYADELHCSLWLWLDRAAADTLVLACWIVPTPVVPVLVGLLTRDVVLRIYLRRVVRMQIERVRCRSCKYVLIGQRVTDGFVTCPECGARIPLQILGVTAEDLVPPAPGGEALADIPAASGRS